MGFEDSTKAKRRAVPPLPARVEERATQLGAQRLKRPLAFASVALGRAFARRHTLARVVAAALTTGAAVLSLALAPHTLRRRAGARPGQCHCRHIRAALEAPRRLRRLPLERVARTLGEGGAALSKLAGEGLDRKSVV